MHPLSSVPSPAPTSRADRGKKAVLSQFFEGGDNRDQHKVLATLPAQVVRIKYQLTDRIILVNRLKTICLRHFAALVRFIAASEAGSVIDYENPIQGLFSMVTVVPGLCHGGWQAPTGCLLQRLRKTIFIVQIQAIIIDGTPHVVCESQSDLTRNHHRSNWVK